jgi:hypothetical protein
MKPRRTYACALAALLTAGCASASGQAVATSEQTPMTGHLAGRLLREGGPLGPDGAQPSERPLSGTVTFTDARHRPVTVQVTSSGRFSVRLPPGRYQVAGRSPAIGTSSGSGGNEPCSPSQSATVAAGRTSAVTITCIVP